MQNERLTMFKSRIETDIKTCEHQLETELHKRNVIEKQMNNTLNIIDRIDKDIQKIYGVRELYLIICLVFRRITFFLRFFYSMLK